MSRDIPLYVSVRIIVLDGNKMLLGFEPSHEGGLGGDHWETPGGHVEPNEDIMTSLKREAKEEIGTEIKIENRLPFFFDYTRKEYDKNYQGSSGIVIYFLCDLLGEPDVKKASDDEFSEIKFIGKKEFQKLSDEDKVMMIDKINIPKIMKKLKLW